MFEKIDHISIHVQDVTSSTEFYIQLGFKLIERPDFGFPGAWFEIAPSYQLHLIGGLADPVISGSRSNHFAICVVDLVSFESHLKKQHIAYRAPKQRPDGITQIFLKDPDGYYWEFNNA